MMDIYSTDSKSAIRTQGLTKVYGIRNAVDSLTIDIPRGQICGFVGPNGAGKTTTIRMLLGLIRPTAGTAEVLGRSTSNPAAYLDGVGALIEGPAFYPGLTARQNLRVLTTLGGIDEARIEEVLEVVDLADRASEPVRNFSLGMQQRLGIAMTLLPDPDLLILDEPTNGLDPAGISEMRDLLRDLAADGRTVFVSSHQLSEIQAICTHLVFINEGKLVYDGSVTSLFENRGPKIVVSPENRMELPLLYATAEKLEIPILDQNESSLFLDGTETSAADVNRAALGEGIILSELRTVKPTLEDIFLEETNGSDSPSFEQDPALVLAPPLNQRSAA